MNARLMNVGYTAEESEKIIEILSNVGILDADEMDGFPQNTSLQPNRLMYNGHQVNFTTDDNVLFYIQITGPDYQKNNRT